VKRSAIDDALKLELRTMATWLGLSDVTDVGRRGAR